MTSDSHEGKGRIPDIDSYSLISNSTRKHSVYYPDELLKPIATGKPEDTGITELYRYSARVFSRLRERTTSQSRERKSGVSVTFV
jgi:hypothetical protein